MNQIFHPPILQLTDLGFKQAIHKIEPSEEDAGLSSETHFVRYEMPFINSTFTYNPLEKTHAWYYVTKCGKGCDGVPLDIRSMDDVASFVKMFAGPK